MKTLEEYKAELQSEMDNKLNVYKDELEFSNMFPEIPVNSFNSFRIAEPKSLEQLALLLTRLKPSNKTSEVSWAGGKGNEITLDTPYLISTESRINNSGLGHIRFQYNGKQLWIKFPVEWLSKFTTVSRRAVTSSEHHYFGGTCMKEIHSMRIRCWPFIKNDKAYYGGDYKLIDAEETNRIIEYFKSYCEEK